MEPVQIDEELAQGYVIPPSPLNFKEYDEDEQLRGESSQVDEKKETEDACNNWYAKMLDLIASQELDSHPRGSGSTESQARKVPHITVIFENTLKKETIQSLPNGVRQSVRIPGSLKNKISPEQAKQWLLFEVKEKQRKKKVKRHFFKKIE